MNDEAVLWLRYADENRRTAELCVNSGLFNPALQNAQQAIEKALKALWLQAGLTICKTHSVGGLHRGLLRVGVDCGLDDEACDLLDSIYLPSKYPLGSVLPDFQPDADTAQRCLDIANRVLQFATGSIEQSGDPR